MTTNKLGSSSFIQYAPPTDRSAGSPKQVTVQMIGGESGGGQVTVQMIGGESGGGGGQLTVQMIGGESGSCRQGGAALVAKWEGIFSSSEVYRRARGALQELGQPIPTTPPVMDTVLAAYAKALDERKLDPVTEERHLNNRDGFGK